MKNKFSGTVDWNGLPPSIEYIDLYHNQFEGNVNLDVLPSSLTYLNVNSNKFNSITGKKRENMIVYGIGGLNEM